MLEIFLWQSQLHTSTNEQTLMGLPLGDLGLVPSQNPLPQNPVMYLDNYHLLIQLFNILIMLLEPSVIPKYLCPFLVDAELISMDAA